MRLGIRFKQIAAVTAIVGVAVIALSLLHMRRLANVVLHESQARSQLLADAILHRARDIVPGAAEPYAALREDRGLQAILESSLYGESVTGADILDTAGVVIASSDSTQIGKAVRRGQDLVALADAGMFEQLRVIYSEEGQLEQRTAMTLGTEAFGSIRIGVSTLLMRQELNASLRPALLTAVVALGVAVFVAGLLAQLVLRPIHVIRSGLSRLGRGEFGVKLDLPQGDEFGDLNTYFNEVSQQLAAGRGGAGGAEAVADTIDQEQLLKSTIAYSQKLVALGRLTAGIAHEVKNPLNAMMIHLELLRTKLQSWGPPSGGPGAGGPATNPLEHVQIIQDEIRRLDQVVQGFLKFTRPEDLRLQPVSMRDLFDEILPIVQSEADAHKVRVIVDAAANVPKVNGDAAMLRQAFLNLAINACQAMPQGGTLRLVCTPASKNRVEVRVEDTGVGIPPEHLGKIFDLYFTTKDHGTGIGLSMVFRIIQMHDGEIEVQSTPGTGTIFKILLPRVADA